MVLPRLLDCSGFIFPDRRNWQGLWNPRQEIRCGWREVRTSARTLNGWRVWLLFDARVKYWCPDYVPDFLHQKLNSTETDGNAHSVNSQVVRRHIKTGNLFSLVSRIKYPHLRIVWIFFTFVTCTFLHCTEYKNDAHFELKRATADAHNKNPSLWKIIQTTHAFNLFISSKTKKKKKSFFGSAVTTHPPRNITEKIMYSKTTTQRTH